jgi:hypothetical protein
VLQGLRRLVGAGELERAHLPEEVEAQTAVPGSRRPAFPSFSSLRPKCSTSFP